MAVPTLTPVSQISAVVLTPTGTHSDVIGNLVFGIYDSDTFVSGAVDQVAYTYKKLVLRLPRSMRTVKSYRAMLCQAPV